MRHLWSLLRDKIHGSYARNAHQAQLDTKMKNDAEIDFKATRLFTQPSQATHENDVTNKMKYVCRDLHMTASFVYNNKNLLDNVYKCVIHHLINNRWPN